MTKNKVEVVVLGGSGLIGRSIIKDYLRQNIKNHYAGDLTRHL